MDRAGQETFIMNVYRNIDRSKVQFDFLCYTPKKGDFDDEILSLGGKIYHQLSFFRSVPGIKQLEIIYGIKKFLTENKEYKTIHFHHFHATSILFKLIGTKLGKAKNIIVHSHNSFAPHPFIHKISRPFLNLFRIERFACSEKAAEWMFDSVNNVKIIKNGISINRYKFSDIKRKNKRYELGITETEKIILHIGRFNYQKNHKFLIDVFEQIKHFNNNVILLLVGIGEELENIQQIVNIKGLQESVKFLGIRNDVADLMSASDLFIFPSIFEGLGIVLIEAQANGLPVLTSSVVPKEACVSNNVQLLSLKNNAKEWAELSIDLLENFSHTNNAEEINNSGYEITHVSQWLQNYYLRIQ